MTDDGKGRTNNPGGSTGQRLVLGKSPTPAFSVWDSTRRIAAKEALPLIEPSSKSGAPAASFGREDLPTLPPASFQQPKSADGAIGAFIKEANDLRTEAKRLEKTECARSSVADKYMEAGEAFRGVIAKRSANRGEHEKAAQAYIEASFDFRDAIRVLSASHGNTGERAEGEGELETDAITIRGLRTGIIECMLEARGSLNRHTVHLADLDSAPNRAEAAKNHIYIANVCTIMAEECRALEKTDGMLQAIVMKGLAYLRAGVCLDQDSPAEAKKHIDAALTVWISDGKENIVKAYDGYMAGGMRPAEFAERLEGAIARKISPGKKEKKE